MLQSLIKFRVSHHTVSRNLQSIYFLKLLCRQTSNYVGFCELESKVTPPFYIQLVISASCLIWCWKNKINAVSLQKKMFPLYSVTEYLYLRVVLVPISDKCESPSSLILIPSVWARILMIYKDHSVFSDTNKNTTGCTSYMQILWYSPASTPVVCTT